MEKLLKLSQILEFIPLSKSQIYNLINQGLFPKPLKIGRTSVWYEKEVVEFQKKLEN